MKLDDHEVSKVTLEDEEVYELMTRLYRVSEDVLLGFIRESNRIENIFRTPTEAECNAHREFFVLQKITIEGLERLLRICQPDALLREKKGQNVRVGNHVPPRGGPNNRRALYALLEGLNEGGLTPYEIYCRYEILHPFTDGNGRTGRALWAWCMLRDRKSINGGFLYHFHYQALAAYQLVD